MVLHQRLLFGSRIIRIAKAWLISGDEHFFHMVSNEPLEAPNNMDTNMPITNDKPIDNLHHLPKHTSPKIELVDKSPKRNRELHGLLPSSFNKREKNIPTRIKENKMTTIEWTEKIWNPLTGCTRMRPHQNRGVYAKSFRQIRALGLSQSKVINHPHSQCTLFEIEVTASIGQFLCFLKKKVNMALLRQASLNQGFKFVVGEGKSPVINEVFLPNT